jgi:hypothetical protein
LERKKIAEWLGSSLSSHLSLSLSLASYFYS